jgi:hypothetical protein
MYTTYPYGGHIYSSFSEVRWAAFFDKIGWKYRPTFNKEVLPPMTSYRGAEFRLDLHRPMYVHVVQGKTLAAIEKDYTARLIEGEFMAVCDNKALPEDNWSPDPAPPVFGSWPHDVMIVGDQPLRDGDGYALGKIYDGLDWWSLGDGSIAPFGGCSGCQQVGVSSSSGSFCGRCCGEHDSIGHYPNYDDAITQWWATATRTAALTKTQRGLVASCEAV